MSTASAPRPSMFDRPAGTLALAGINGLLWGVVVSILIGATPFTSDLMKALARRDIHPSPPDEFQFEVRIKPARPG